MARSNAAGSKPAAIIEFPMASTEASGDRRARAISHRGAVWREAIATSPFKAATAKITAINEHKNCRLEKFTPSFRSFLRYG
jgi:hypothetical protein